MKKILIILIMGILLLGCQSEAKTTVCTTTLYEPVEVEREIFLHHKDNIITKVESIETFKLSEDFDKQMFLDLEASMKERHLESKNLTFTSEIEGEVGKMMITLNNLDSATTIELLLIGLNKDDEENVAGIKETVRFNENEGYTCKLLSD